MCCVCAGKPIKASRARNLVFQPPWTEHHAWILQFLNIELLNGQTQPQTLRRTTNKVVTQSSIEGTSIQVNSKSVHTLLILAKK
jgi:hypothetical protein